MVLLYIIYDTVTWIPSICSSHVSIYTSTMDPMGNGQVKLLGLGKPNGEIQLWGRQKWTLL